jgi:hypothetical protein
MKIKGNYKGLQFDFEGDLEDFLSILRELENKYTISYPEKIYDNDIIDCPYNADEWKTPEKPEWEKPSTTCNTE